jgi:hypothetical protein
VVCDGGEVQWLALQSHDETCQSGEEGKVAICVYGPGKSGGAWLAGAVEIGIWRSSWASRGPKWSPSGEATMTARTVRRTLAWPPRPGGSPLSGLGSSGLASMICAA